MRGLHVALNVTDLDRAAEFYGGLLGLEVIDRPLKFPGLWYAIGDWQIHLIVAPQVVNTIQDDRWGRNPHLAIAVDDLEILKTQLTAAGIFWQASASGRAAIFVQDPDGNLLEFQTISEQAKV
ncbi:MAG: glyoxalase [Oscillatoriales cyanobacterium]|nr:MAG: glyoxalase [Oscillatoriales cyanobacterium]